MNALGDRLNTEDLDKLTTYTLEEVDEQLEALSNLLRHARKPQRKKIFKSVDRWLDIRLEHTNG